MAQTLVFICEKTNVMKDILHAYKKYRKQLKYKFVFASAQGHIFDVPMPSIGAENHLEYLHGNPTQEQSWSFNTLPLIPKQFINWDWSNSASMSPQQSPYRVLESKKTYYQKMLTAIKSEPTISAVVIATDNDMEGGVIGAEIISQLPEPIQQLPRFRFWTDDTSTDEAILEAMNNLKPLNAKMENGAATYASYINAGILRQQGNYVGGLSDT